MSRVAIALAGLCLLMIGGINGPRASARDPDFELVLWQRPRLARIELRLEVDDVEWATAWNARLTALAAYFDRNGDSTLDEAEARRLPSGTALQEMLGLGFVSRLGEAPSWKDIDQDGNGKASLDEVRDYYRRLGLSSPRVAAAALPFSESLTTSLLKLLDADGDGRVSTAELRGSAELLAKLDRNDDELLGAGEIVAKVLYPGVSGGNILLPAKALATPRQAFPVLLLPADQNDVQWSETVISGLDKDGNGKIAPSEIGWDAATFSRLDGDGDKLLTTQELSAWRDVPPDHASTIRLSASLVLPPKFVDQKNAQTASNLEFNVGRTNVSLRADKGRLEDALKQVRRHFTGRFTSADDDENNILSPVELEQDGVTAELRTLVDTADRNEDGSLSHEELDSWLEFQQKLAGVQALVTILAGSGGLFEFLDANHDGAISIPEFRTAAVRMEAAGALRDGFVDAKQIPDLLLIAVSQGYPQSTLGGEDRAGPAWFVAMDRNADGFVSRREFSGTPETFKSLDADKDGFLTAIEAAKTAK